MESIKIAALAIIITLFAVGYVVAEGKTVKQAPQTNCPVMGGTINKDIYADYEGKRVYFCCAGCIPEFQKDPAKYIKKLEDEGVVLDNVPKAELKNKGNPATASECKQSKSSGGCGDCGCL
jgi:YHS domain-containing protein